MNPLRKIISASLSPNTQSSDVVRALGTLLIPWKWIEGDSIRLVERWFEERYAQTRALSFNSGRSALLAILNAFGIGSGDEVLLQAFTCVAVPNSVLWAGAKPVFVDIDNTLNVDIVDAQRKVTAKTRAIIVQHTFGIPADMEKVTAFAKKHRLLVIEDCAHALGASYKGEEVGTFGDAAFFSFGRDKVVSSVFGGMAIIRIKHVKETERLINYQKSLNFPAHAWVLQQLLHPLIFAIVIPFYTAQIGKGILWICQRLHLLSFPVYPKEKRAQKPEEFPKKYPNGLAFLLRLQLTKLTRYNTHRQEIARLYEKRLQQVKGDMVIGRPGSVYLRFSVLRADHAAIFEKAKKSGILLGNWYHNVIDPDGVDFHAISYTRGSCPNSEQAAKKIINLPTNISKAEAEFVSDQLV